MIDLTGFLLARVAEDEAVAREARVSARAAGSGDLTWSGLNPGYDSEDGPWDGVEMSAARVLAECEAKRRIVEECADLAYSAGVFSTAEEDRAVAILAVLAQPYADHANFREEWRV